MICSVFVTKVLESWITDRADFALKAKIDITIKIIARTELTAKPTINPISIALKLFYMQMLLLLCQINPYLQRHEWLDISNPKEFKIT